ncbi:MAG: hypothetical protein AAB512_03640, partial [Patescibacteria group bacterium]
MAANTETRQNTHKLIPAVGASVASRATRRTSKLPLMASIVGIPAIAFSGIAAIDGRSSENSAVNRNASCDANVASTLTMASAPVADTQAELSALGFTINKSVEAVMPVTEAISTEVNQSTSVVVDAGSSISEKLGEKYGIDKSRADYKEALSKLVDVTGAKGKDLVNPGFVFSYDETDQVKRAVKEIGGVLPATQATGDETVLYSSDIPEYELAYAGGRITFGSGAEVNNAPANPTPDTGDFTPTNTPVPNATATPTMVPADVFITPEVTHTPEITATQPA